MSPGEYAIWASIALLGILGSALCSGMETGLYGLNHARLTLLAREPRGGGREDARGGWRARALEREVRSPDRSIATLLVGNNAFNYLGILSVSVILEARGFAPAGLIILNAIIVTPILLVFAESLPKELFRRNANALSVFFSPTLVFLRLALSLSLVLPLVLTIARAAGRATGLPAEPELGLRARIADMLKQDDAQLTSDQAELIDRAMGFGRARVGDVMTPWAGVETIGADWDRDRCVRFIAQRSHRRYPVVDEAARVLGTLDSMLLLLDEVGEPRTLIEPMADVSPQASVSDTLGLLSKSGAAMAMVRAQGVPLGLVTPKDLVEPLTGELLAW